MKKTLLSIVAGITVVSTAFALPTPGDRRTACMEKPLERVWVEKTETCVPINPCATGTKSIRQAYCIETQGTVASERVAKLAIERYAKNVLNVEVKSVKDFGHHDAVDYYAVYTKDGGYYGFQFDRYHSDDPMGQLRTACWAYGKNSDIQSDNAKFACLGVANQAQCNNIADFATLLDGDAVEGTLEQLGQKVCWLTNENYVLNDGVIVSPQEK